MGESISRFWSSVVSKFTANALVAALIAACGAIVMIHSLVNRVDILDARVAEDRTGITRRVDKLEERFLDHITEQK